MNLKIKIFILATLIQLINSFLMSHPKDPYRTSFFGQVNSNIDFEIFSQSKKQFVKVTKPNKTRRRSNLILKLIKLN